MGLFLLKLKLFKEILCQIEPIKDRANTLSYSLLLMLFEEE